MDLELNIAECQILEEQDNFVSRDSRQKTEQNSTQLSLFPKPSLMLGKYGTFAPNHKESVHRWYPYVEGFSSNFALELLSEFEYCGCRVHDPFAGTGTTLTVAATKGMLGSYSEINPFMRLIIECKTNGLRRVASQRDVLIEYLERVEIYARTHLPTVDEAQRELGTVFANRAYFIGSRLVEIIAIKKAISECESKEVVFRNFAYLALCSIAIACSEMKRGSDLRYRTLSEKLPENFSVLDAFYQKVQQICCDVDKCYSDLPVVACLGESAIAPYHSESKVDFILTSPPYLNGTNYFRNTKLELWLSGSLKCEKDLKLFRTSALAAGINNISKHGRLPTLISEVEAIASKLDEVAYDERIPELVRRYFSDSLLWLRNAYNLLRPGGIAAIDIGDSRYAGIHIPTDEILSSIAQKCGFSLLEERLIRNRKSKDGEALKQVLLIFKKGNSSNVL